MVQAATLLDAAFQAHASTQEEEGQNSFAQGHAPPQPQQQQQQAPAEALSTLVARGTALLGQLDAWAAAHARGPEAAHGAVGDVERAWVQLQQLAWCPVLQEAPAKGEIATLGWFWLGLAWTVDRSRLSRSLHIKTH